MRPNSPITTSSVFAKRPADVHVLDQSRQRPVELGQLLVERFEDLGVMVPAGVVHGDEPHAALDQPAGQQHRLADGIPAVAIAQTIRFLIDGEGPAGLAREHHLAGAGVELVVGGDLVVPLDAPGQSVDGLQERFAAHGIARLKPSPAVRS